jgi:hypothetical protein
MVPVPPRSLQQRKEALLRANEIRTYRATLKRDIKAGRDNITKHILDPTEKLDTMKIVDFMLAIPKLGRTKVNQMLVKCRISPSKTLGGLSERQREELVLVLRRRISQ